MIWNRRGTFRHPQVLYLQILYRKGFKYHLSSRARPPTSIPSKTHFYEDLTVVQVTRYWCPTKLLRRLSNRLLHVSWLIFVLLYFPRHNVPHLPPVRWEACPPYAFFVPA